MPTLLESHWPKLVLLLTLTLFAGLFFVPALAQGFVLPLIALMLGMGCYYWPCVTGATTAPANYPGANWRVISSSKPPFYCWSLSWPGLRAGFVQEDYGWLLSALVVGAAAGLAVHKTLGRWVKG